MNLTNKVLIQFSQNLSAQFDRLLSDPEWPWRSVNPEMDLTEMATSLHFFNTSLWNEEDLARRTLVSDAEIAKNKRAIDKFNQSRNDQIEKIDDLILTNLFTDLANLKTGYRSSETAGSMVDRISILSLKIHHMTIQAQRTDVDETHRGKANARVEILQEQRSDLVECLIYLFQGMSQGTAYYKIYRQFKMYNDPSLNPALVAERTAKGHF
jgi:hypothetical protein